MRSALGMLLRRWIRVTLLGSFYEIVAFENYRGDRRSNFLAVLDHVSDDKAVNAFPGFTSGNLAIMVITSFT